MIDQITTSHLHIRYRQIFSGGVSDQNENLVGKFQKSWKILKILKNFEILKDFKILEKLGNFLRGGIGPKWKFGRTKMKNWSKNFSHSSSLQKKGFPNFLLRRPFFVMEALKTTKNPLKTVKFS